MDFEDIPMDDVPSMSEEDELKLQVLRQQEQEAAAIKSKTEQEIQLDWLNQLITSSSLNSWERGFCTSCEQWLQKSVTNRLSYKQKDVLLKVFEKYFN